MLEFGNLIRDARARTGEPGSEIAHRAGISLTILSDLELNKKRQTPSPKVIAGLSKALGIPQSAMLEAIGYELDRKLETKHEDPREQLIERVRALPRHAGVDGSLEIAVSLLEHQEKTRRKGS